MGLDVENVGEVNTAFSPISGHLAGHPVELIDDVCMKRATKLYGVKILNTDVLTKLPNNAKNLSGTNFSHIYIKRDLTYTQRQTL